MFAPVTDALVENAGIIRGYHVLDVGTGPGEPALSIAELLGSEGTVAGIDPAPEMVSAAMRAAERLRLCNINFQTAPADNLPFSSATFDAVVSRFAVMFFRSPIDGIREMLRVLKPGRKLAVAAWHFADRNPFHYVFSRVVDRYVQSTPTDPNAPDAFRFAERGKLRNILDEAGVVRPSERVLEFRIEAPVSLDDFWTLRSEMSEKLRTKVATLTEETVREVRAQVFEDLKQYWTGGLISIPAEVIIVSGSAPGQSA
jgi:ubiquinone/menaquinone biosynthesis C-methylase UbiE